MLKISIITPAFNAEEYISDYMDSVLKQTYKCFELIIVNDGSEDNTLNIINEYARHDNRIIIINKKNEGVSCARNDALKIATGEYVLFLDADDWINENMLEVMVDDAIKKKVDVVICGYSIYLQNEKRIAHMEIYGDDCSFGVLITEEKNQILGYLWNKLIKKNMISHYFERDIHVHEDLLFLLNNFNSLMNYSIINRSLYNYRIHNNATTNLSKFNIKQLTVLKAIYKIIPLIPQDKKNAWRIRFLKNYYEYGYIVRKNNIHIHLFEELKSYENECFHKIVHCNDIRILEKIKLFIAREYPIFFYEIKNQL